MAVTTHMHPLDALGSPIRRNMLKTLHASAMTVGELAAKYPVSRPAVSRHLKMLQQAGLVMRRRDGARTVYAVRLQGFVSVRAFIDDFWDSALARLQELSRR